MAELRSRTLMTVLATLIATLWAAVGPTEAQPQGGRDTAEEITPPGVTQIIPRGAIPAVFEPEFVDAEEADVSDDAWVLGVYLNGEARAYSLNLLNHHEVVNDVVGGKPIAAVW